MKLTLEVLGIDKFESEINSSLDNFGRETLKKIRAEVETSLERGGKSGRKYQRIGRVHIASAAGETPARDTGDLWGSISQVRSGGGVSEFEITAGHAGLLEDGTSKMAARPFVAPAVDLVLEQTIFEL